MNIKKLLIIFCLVLILLGIGFRVVSLNNEITGEEADFVNPAIALMETGHPLFYHSEQQPLELALWHPPTYIMTLSLLMRFGESEIILRSLNFIFVILTAFLIYLFCYKIIGEEKGKWIGLISCAFFMINYYVFSSSVIIDIDILSMFFTFGFIYSILRYHQEHKKFHFYLSYFFLLFSIGNRYPMAFLIYVGIGIYYFFNKEFKKDFYDYFKIGLISFFSFVIIWGIYSIFIEPGNFFSFLIHNANIGGSQFSTLGIYLGSFFLNIAQFIRLLTFPVVILMCWSFFYFLKRKSNLVNILLIYSLVILIFFFLVPRPAFGYPRYFATILPAIFILIGMFIYSNLKKINMDKKEIVIVIICFLISIILLLILNPQPTIYNSAGLIKATNFPDFLMNIFASIPFMGVLFIDKRKRKVALILILVLLSLSYSGYFITKNVMYESHIKEVGIYLQEHTQEEDVVICPKAIGYYFGGKFYINDHDKPLLNFSSKYLFEYFKKSFENSEMNDSFFWPNGIYSGIVEPIPKEEALEKSKYVVKYYPVEGFEPEVKIGEFYIYNLEQLTI